MSLAVFEIPLISSPQKFNVQLGALVYSMRVQWRDVEEGGWFLDIADQNDVPIVRGIPFVTGADLLAQYKYLGFGGKLFVQSDSNPDETPSFTNLGQTSHLYWLPN